MSRLPKRQTNLQSYWTMTMTMILTYNGILTKIASFNFEHRNGDSFVMRFLSTSSLFFCVCILSHFPFKFTNDNAFNGIYRILRSKSKQFARKTSQRSRRCRFYGAELIASLLLLLLLFTCMNRVQGRLERAQRGSSGLDCWRMV